MNRGVPLSLPLIALSLLAMWKVVDQHGELAALRAKQQRLLAELAQPVDNSATTPATVPGPAAADSSGDTTVPLELLKLRGQVTLLTQRRDDLAGVRAENEKLQAQLAARATNPAAAMPPGYIMRSKAKWSGFSTPEDTLQTFLWAIQNHDLTNLFAAVSPRLARQFQEELARKGGAVSTFLDQGALSSFPGARVLDRQTQPDGSVILQVQVDPRSAKPDHGLGPMRFRFIDGRWKLDL
jgi:hypothetical protein